MGLALAGAWFGFANPMGHLPLAIFLLPLALAFALRSATSLRQAWVRGFLTAWPGYTASLYWLAIPVHDHGGLPWALALPCPVLIGAYLAAYAGLFCGGLFLADKAPLAVRALIAGTLWASLELLRNHLFTGFSWLTLASALVPWTWSIGMAAWIGAFGMSGLVASSAYLLARGHGPWKCAAAIPAGLLLVPLLFVKPSPPVGVASAALIQGNIAQDQKWEPTLQAQILDTYLRLTRQAIEHKPDIVIWPETSVPFYIQDAGPLADTLTATLAQQETAAIIGAPAYSVLLEPRQSGYALHNRAYLFDNTGNPVSWYDKEHLVPFGEYVPLGRWFPFLAKLVPGEYEFKSGDNRHLLRSKRLRIGMLICYEAIFPELAQRQVDRGANVLVNISNDGWFGRSSAPLQHLHLTALRAVEQNRSVIRATNTGISAFIAPDGSIRGQTALFASDIAHEDRIALLTDTTFYHEHFFLIHGAFPFLTVAILFVIRRKDRARH